MERFVINMAAMAVVGIIALTGEFFAGRWNEGLKKNGTKRRQ